jgi:hypothetical protein
MLPSTYSAATFLTTFEVTAGERAISSMISNAIQALANPSKALPMIVNIRFAIAFL